jgi:hypothetical protein
MADAQNTADVLSVVGSISQHAGGATARPTTWPLERRDTVEQC